ncbi:MAG: FtsW/RodA/SpoVE family cell cycle protein [Rothia sp. (in: high G+C Gram-positive bacteria)]|nr:FtsW/RodA/SpoVE family cell cycle protein [Rothia sp. (in: high G+C Gram-positive bacteria)]
MSLTAQPPADKPQGNIRRTGSWLKQGWEHVQVRLGSMVLSDVPLVLIGTVLVLTAFGVIMVLSASSVEQISAGLVPYAQARSQAIFAVLGFGLMLLIGFGIPVWFYRKPWVLYTALGICVGLLLTVIFFGVSVGGNRNWIELPGFNLQPSEVAKPVTILWLAMVFSRQGAIDRGSAAQTLYKALIPSTLGVGVVLALILAGHDLGTVLIYALFFVTMLLAAKPSRSTIIVALGALALAAF